VTLPLANLDPTFQPLFDAKFSILCTLLAILESEQRLSLSPKTSCGHPSRKTAAYGPELAKPANVPKSHDTLSPQLATSPSLLPASYTSTSTWLDRFLPRQDFSIASLSSTVSHAGQKQYQLQTSQQKQWPMFCSLDGFHVLVVHNPSPPTRDANSNPNSSTTLQRFVAFTSAEQPLITLLPTILWNACIEP